MGGQCVLYLVATRLLKLDHIGKIKHEDIGLPALLELQT